MGADQRTRAGNSDIHPLIVKAGCLMGSPGRFTRMRSLTLTLGVVGVLLGAAMSPASAIPPEASPPAATSNVTSVTVGPDCVFAWVLQPTVSRLCSTDFERPCLGIPPVRLAILLCTKGWFPMIRTPLLHF